MSKQNEYYRFSIISVQHGVSCILPYSSSGPHPLQKEILTTACRYRSAAPMREICRNGFSLVHSRPYKVVAKYLRL